MRKTMSSIVFVSFISLVIGCTTPPITINIEEPISSTPAQNTAGAPVRAPMVCTLETHGGEPTQSSETTSFGDDYPSLPELDNDRINDHEYIVGRLLDYIEELQTYIEENS